MRAGPLVLAILFAIVGAPALRAQSASVAKKVEGWILVQKTTVDSGTGRAPTARSVRSAGSGSRLRLESPSRNGSTIVTITDTVTHEQMLIMAERKLASVVHPPKMDFHVEPRSLERQVKDLGPGESIAGLPTHRYEVTAKTGSRISSGARTCDLQRLSTQQLWMTTDVRAMNAIRSQVNLLSASVEAASALRSMRQKEPPGEAVRTISSHTVIDGNGKRRTITTTSELADLSVGQIDAALFEVPPGYQRQAPITPTMSLKFDSLTRAAGAHAFAMLVDSAPAIVGETRTCTTNNEPVKSKP
jgi:hypothetical protein